jgi:hypothetical protein
LFGRCGLRPFSSTTVVASCRNSLFRVAMEFGSAKLPSNHAVVAMGLSRLELLTFPLSEGCSNRLSYRPILRSCPLSASALSFFFSLRYIRPQQPQKRQAPTCLLTPSSLLLWVLLVPRKEVIQPQLPLRLPCYDFVPVTRPTFGGGSLSVHPPTSGVASSHDVTGGVYKARERIHRTVADARLLATPASCRRVAAYNPN